MIEAIRRDRYNEREIEICVSGAQKNPPAKIARWKREPIAITPPVQFPNKTARKSFESRGKRM